MTADELPKNPPTTAASANGDLENGVMEDDAHHRPRMSSRSSRISPTDSELTTKIGGSESKILSSTAWTIPEADGESDGSEASGTEESRLSFVLQCFIPFLLAGMGMVAAGLLLERASTWPFLMTVPEALIMVPALLGLKGNLEMTLASRLSTLANLGQMDTRKQQLAALVSNLALVQAQAIVVSFAASLLTAATSLAEGQSFVWNHFISLTLTGVLTASAASLILSTMMVVLAIFCKKLNCNPDNVCTPIAAMLGDSVTLFFMIIFGTYLTDGRDTAYIAQTIALGFFLCSTAFWIAIAARFPTTLEVVKHGWYIIILAMCISSGGGYVLKFAVARYKALAVFQPVINGVGGNLVAVQASRISTYLHRFGKPGVLPLNSLRTYANPVRTFSLREEESYHALLLLLMSVPGHSIFLAVIFLIQFHLMFCWRFYAAYVAIGTIQVAILLYICQFVTRAMWRARVNPDSNAIPLLTSLGDLLGTSLLTLMFAFLTAVAPDSLARLTINE
ncbi:hypothetical protein M3Y99_01155100 [Aphelenchoides fujianensis]|nr:hypothetical protein M3Y99_01155100 [Aphelenchoides fujianensis]